MTAAEFDRIDVGTLRRAGSVKWSMYPEAIGAFLAEMDFGTAPPVTAALHTAVEAAAFGYLPAGAAEQMSAACAAWSRDRYGWAVDPVDVRPVADVVAALTLAIEHFSAPGTPVVLPTPAYMPFVSVPPRLGREVIEVPLTGEHRYDLDALAAAFEAGGDLLVVCNPHNPVGRVLEPDEMRALADIVERHGGRVFSDEIHAPLVYDGHRHVPYVTVSDAAARHAVTAVSASKAWNLPGTKCAQLVLSNDADAERWAEVGMLAEHGASNVGVAANIAAYESGGPWLADVLAYLDGSRHLLAELLAEHLPEVRYTPPEGTYLAWLDCRALGLGDHPAEFFREHAGVALTDGPQCGDSGAGFVRHNLATPRAVLEQSVAQMAQALTRR